MSDERDRQEKEEKEEKDEGGSEGEKWSGEKWSEDPLARITLALIIIWAGVVLLLSNLADDQMFLGIDWGDAWAWIFTGAGVLVWIEVLLRLAIPAYRRPVGGRLILGTILVIIGVGSVVDVSLWPLILIAVGVALLLGYLSGPRRF